MYYQEYITLDIMYSWYYVLLILSIAQFLVVCLIVISHTANRWLGYWGKHMKSEAFKNVKPYQKVTVAL